MKDLIVLGSKFTLLPDSEVDATCEMPDPPRAENVFVLERVKTYEPNPVFLPGPLRPFDYAKTLKRGKRKR